MNYPLSELENCIFDYLASKPDILISINKILMDITCTSGYRCDALEHLLSTNNHFGQKKFFEACDNLDSNFKNVHKFYNQDDNLFYLMFSTEKKPTMNSFDNDDNNNGNLELSINQNIILDYFLKNNNTNKDNKYTEFIKSYLSKCTVDDAKSIFEQYSFSNQEIFNLAKNNNNMDLVIYLLKERYAGKITKLKADNLVLKKNNTVLLIKNNTLESHNKKLIKENLNLNGIQWSPIISFVVIIFVLLAYIFH